MSTPFDTGGIPHLRLRGHRAFGLPGGTIDSWWTEVCFARERGLMTRELTRMERLILALEDAARRLDEVVPHESHTEPD